MTTIPIENQSLQNMQSSFQSTCKSKFQSLKTALEEYEKKQSQFVDQSASSRTPDAICADLRAFDEKYNKHLQINIQDTARQLNNPVNARQSLDTSCSLGFKDRRASYSLNSSFVQEEFPDIESEKSINKINGLDITRRN